jgi:pSer/pThr/pTyr-binding forkhead associated (FHA) protein
MPAQLLALMEGPNILLDKPILLFGRHPECDVQLHSRKVSRRHCCVAQVSDYFVVRDLGSTNGVRINGQRVAEGRLNAGDELAIGSFRYQVCWEKPAEAPRKARPVAAAADEDDRLESCDEPVPLGEPGPASPKKQ